MLSYVSRIEDKALQEAARKDGANLLRDGVCGRLLFVPFSFTLVLKLAI